MTKRNVPRAGTKGFLLTVFPSREALDEAISANGFCNPTDCWHYVAISTEMEQLAPGDRHHVRIDGGHVKLNYRGWRYIADTPRHVKHSLMLFDLKRYTEVRVREYNLRFRRTTKIVKVSEERQEQINTARIARIAAGGDERKRYKGRPTLRKRIEGFSGIV